MSKPWFVENLKEFIEASGTICDILDSQDLTKEEVGQVAIFNYLRDKVIYNLEFLEEKKDER